MIKYLTLRARHFKNTDFGDNCNCAISKAAKEKLKVNYLSEGIHYLRIFENDKTVCYDHKEYDYKKHFLPDSKLAEENNFDDTKIRTIRLTLRK